MSQEAGMTVFDIAGIVLYTLLGITAFWGGLCVIVVWMRVGQKRFRSEGEQDACDEKDFQCFEQIGYVLLINHCLKNHYQLC